jgi:ATP-binding cassette subfamily F protein uup
VKVSYIDQTRAELDGDKTVVHEVGGGHSSVKIGTRLVRIESFLGRFLFDSKQFRTPVRDLSGGERNRVLLAKLLLCGGNVLVLDEPTNDLDLMTLRVLEEALIAFSGTVLVVTHDRYFLDRVATRILYLDGKGAVREWPGDMTGLLEQLKEEAKQRAPREKKEKPKRERRGPRKRSYMEQREFDGLPDRIAALEEEIASIDLRLADPEFYARPDVGEVTVRRKEAESELAVMYARWEELERGA